MDNLLATLIKKSVFWGPVVFSVALQVYFPGAMDGLLALLAKYEPIWLPTLFMWSITYERDTLVMAEKEYEYDKNKDDQKARKKTRTTKKTTTQPGGASVVEEQTETEVVGPDGSGK